jgi:hypothetical protein
MALYVPAGARRRRVVLALLGGLVVGLLAGFLLGRVTSPDLADDVSRVQGMALDATTTLQRIPIEYAQALSGRGGESTATVTEAFDRAHAQLDDAYAAALWLPEDASATTDASFDHLTELVDAQVPPAELEQAIGDLVDQIETTFVITAEPVG